MQFTGSRSGIQCLFDPWIRDSGMEKFGSGMEKLGFGIQIKHHGSETLMRCMNLLILERYDS